MSLLGHRRTKPVMPARSYPLRSESDAHPALPRNDEMGRKRSWRENAGALPSFTVKRGREDADARGVAVWPSHRVHQSRSDHVAEDHLRELGFPLGARLKILKAIGVLGKHAEATSPSADAATSPTVPGLTSEDRAERRQVTVMFSDLVGSTALSARVDPEGRQQFVRVEHVHERRAGRPSSVM
jgi:hypothetical protein